MAAYKVLALVAAIAALGAASATASDRGGHRERGGYVLPCSLDGVNPAYHPDIFANPAAAAAFGFVQSRDGIWHVQSDCRRH